MSSNVTSNREPNNIEVTKLQSSQVVSSPVELSAMAEDKENGEIRETDGPEEQDEDTTIEPGTLDPKSMSVV